MITSHKRQTPFFYQSFTFFSLYTCIFLYRITKSKSNQKCENEVGASKITIASAGFKYAVIST